MLDSPAPATMPPMPRRPQRYKALREAIVRELELQGLTVTDLARASGVDRTIIHRFTAGEIDTTSEKLDAMLAALRVEIRPHIGE